MNVPVEYVVRVCMFEMVVGVLWYTCIRTHRLPVVLCILVAILVAVPVAVLVAVLVGVLVVLVVLVLVATVFALPIHIKNAALGEI